MGEIDETSMETCCVRRDRRNAMWNIFEGVEDAVLQNLSGLSMEMVQQLVTDSAHDAECLSLLSPTSSSSSSESSTTSSPSPDNPWCCERARIQRSFSVTAGDEVRAALQNRQRRNAVGNLFDLLTPSQKLLLVEHLQEQVERLHSGLCGEVSGENLILSLTDLKSTSSTSSSSSSTVSSPRSQGEIVCR